MSAVYQRRVAKGAALLDRVEPGWATRISVDRLAMTSCDHCILGQLYGDYLDGFREVLRRVDGPIKLYSSAEHGFTLSDALQDTDYVSRDIVLGRFKALADAWRVEIRKRLAGRADAP